MTNPLTPVVRFVLYVVAALVGLVIVGLTTHDPVAVLAGAQSVLLGLAAAKVDLK